MPVTLRFNSLGIFWILGATLVRQDVSRNARSTFSGERSSDPEGNSSFVVFDAAAGYRLPNRYGLLSLVVSNLLDTGFDYKDESFRRFADQPPVSRYLPERTVLLQAYLAF